MTGEARVEAEGAKFVGGAAGGAHGQGDPCGGWGGQRRRIARRARGGYPAARSVNPGVGTASADGDAPCSAAPLGGRQARRSRPVDRSST